MLNKREDGRSFETMAMEFLKARGIEILERNFYLKDAEIDLVYRDGDYICFAEVKHRKNAAFGNPYEAVTLSKRKKICKASRVYLYKNHYPESTMVRYDILSVLDNEITFFENAFDYC